MTTTGYTVADVGRMFIPSSVAVTTADGTAGWWSTITQGVFDTNVIVIGSNTPSHQIADSETALTTELSEEALAFRVLVGPGSVTWVSLWEPILYLLADIERVGGDGLNGIVYHAPDDPDDTELMVVRDPADGRIHIMTDDLFNTMFVRVGW